jgi:hypothetical protein
MNDDQRYIYHELHKAEPDTHDDVVRMKLSNETGGESRWVSLPHHTMDLVITMAALTERQASLMGYAIRLMALGHIETPAEDMQTEMGEALHLLLGTDVGYES